MRVTAPMDGLVSLQKNQMASGGYHTVRLAKLNRPMTCGLDERRIRARYSFTDGSCSATTSPAFSPCEIKTRSRLLPRW